RPPTGSEGSRSPAGRRSVVAERVDQLALRHRRAALDADLLRLVVEVVLRPLLVGPGPAALAAGRRAGRRGRRVRDPRRLLLAGALAAQRLVLLLVLDAGVRHPRPPGSSCGPARPRRASWPPLPGS